MLSQWGYIYFVGGIELAFLESALERGNVRSGVSNEPPRLDPTGQLADLIIEKCDTFLRITAGTHQDLGSIPGEIERLRAKVWAARRAGGIALHLEMTALIDDVRTLRNNLSYVLERRHFYSVRPDLSDYYGAPEPFGDHVATKFKDARDDIERAGNCLALGESTACVLHLNRAMEIVIRALARKLRMTIVAKDNWGSLLGNMADKINKMPDHTEREKRKKELWAECRTNLYHVKMAWRDNTMHGKVSYDEKQAIDIYRRVKDFMQQLATL
jgi:hypothetical protein